MYKNIYKYVYKYAWIRKQIHIFYMYLCIFFQNQIDTIYMSILYSRRYIFYTRNLTFSYVFFFLFPRLDDVDCPAPAEKMRFSYRLSVLAIHRWNSHGSWRCNAMGVDDIHSLKN